MTKRKETQESLPLPDKKQHNSIAAFTAILWTNYLDSQLRDPLERSQVIVMVEILISVMKSLESGQLIPYSIVEKKPDGKTQEFIVPPITGATV